MQRSCAACGSSFKVLDSDLAFYDQISPVFGGKKYPLPPPDQCPDCRHQRRSAFRNERVLYNRTCDLCGKNTVTVLSGDRPLTVYCADCWWRDSWGGEESGRDFDFSRPFFEQLAELQDKVPRLCMNNAKHENSEYCNQCVENKNCYLLWAADANEDCMYSYWINRCTDTFNSSNTADSVLCYDAVDCEKCHHCVYSQDLVNCSDCAFCFDLIGCQNCLRCAGLRNKQYHVDNQQKTREEYEAALSEARLDQHSQYTKQASAFTQLRTKVPNKYVRITNSENCTGDYISNCKDCYQCFDVFDSEQCRYAYNAVHQHFNNMDVSYVTETRDVYQIMSAVGERLFFSTLPWYSSDIWYCDLVQNCSNLFGCVGLKRKEYCILNKQYTKEEYEELVSKIIEHMQRTGEWGTFFTPQMSPFAYNETVAMDYCPLTKEHALRLGYRWKDELGEPTTAVKVIQAAQIPDSIDDVPDDILDWAVVCEATGRPYKIQKRELDFLRQVRLPVPRLHPDERQMRRIALRNPRRLWQRQCGKCKKEILTSYAPERPEKVYCEECYLKEMY